MRKPTTTSHSPMKAAIDKAKPKATAIDKARIAKAKAAENAADEEEERASKSRSQKNAQDRADAKAIDRDEKRVVRTDKRSEKLRTPDPKPRRAEKAAPSFSETLHFVIVPEKETKGTHRYAEVNGDGEELEIVDAFVGSLYLRKSALNGAKAPKKLRVTLES